MSDRLKVDHCLNAKISRFQNLLSVNKSTEVSLKDWAEEIRSETHSEKIEAIRSRPKGEVRDSMKKQLPCVTISGVCSEGRGKGQDLTNHSGLLQLDFDNVHDLKGGTQTLMDDAHVLMVCLSPSGEGLKAVAAINPNKHKESFEQASRWFSNLDLELDKSTKDPKRTFFVSSDSNLWIREEGEVQVFTGEASAASSITTNECSVINDEIENQFGAPIVYTRQGLPKTFNQNWFSEVMRREGRYKWDKVRKEFFKYNDKTGVWESADTTEIKTKAGELGLDLLRQEGWIFEKAQLASESFRRSVVEDLKGRTATEFLTEMTSRLHVKNGMLSVEQGKIQLRSFDPSALSLHALPVSYDPTAKCRNFLRGLLGNLSSSDRLLLQKMAGACLFGQNPAQKILFISGDAGSGKSCFLETLQYMVGHRGSTEIRVGQLGERFETHRYIGKRFLYCDDARINLLQGKNSEVLKKLTGGTMIDAERKNSTKELYVRGDFPILFTSNTSLALKLNGDVNAWRRRILIVLFTSGSNQKVPNFAQKIFEEESSGILNWALDGWAYLQKDLSNSGQFQVTTEQQKLIDDLLMESESLSVFVKKCIVEKAGEFLSSEDAGSKYEKFCENSDWTPNNRMRVQREMPILIAKQFGRDKIRKSNKRGWEGLSVGN